MDNYYPKNCWKKKDDHIAKGWMQKICKKSLNLLLLQMPLKDLGGGSNDTTFPFLEGPKCKKLQKTIFSGAPNAPKSHLRVSNDQNLHFWRGKILRKKPSQFCVCSKYPPKSCGGLQWPTFGFGGGGGAEMPETAPLMYITDNFPLYLKLMKRYS